MKPPPITSGVGHARIVAADPNTDENMLLGLSMDIDPTVLAAVIIHPRSPEQARINALNRWPVDGGLPNHVLMTFYGSAARVAGATKNQELMRAMLFSEALAGCQTVRLEIANNESANAATLRALVDDLFGRSNIWGGGFFAHARLPVEYLLQKTIDVHSAHVQQSYGRAGVHSRPWVSPSTLDEWIKRLLEEPDGNDRLSGLVVRCWESPPAQSAVETRNVLLRKLLKHAPPELRALAALAVDDLP